MRTQYRLRMWSVALALLVIGLMAAVPVWADPGIRLGAPDEPATGYAPVSAPVALPATGAQASARPYHTIFELRQLEDGLAAPETLPVTGAQPARPHHTIFELRQLEEQLAAPTALPATGARSSARPWHTVGQIPREQVEERPHHTMFELRQVEASLGF